MLILVNYFIILSLYLVITTDSLLQHTPSGLVSVSKKNEKGANFTLLFLSEPAPANKNENSGVFVLFDADEQQDDTFLEDARKTANLLDIPLLSASDSTSFHQGCSTFTHALRLVPYEYGTELSTFALAIEPIETHTPNDGKSQRRQKRKPKKIKSSSSTAFFVDLCPPRSSRAGRRAAGASGTSDLLVKAVGPRKSFPNNNSSCDKGTGAIVWDLTAGFGQDSLVLAMNGAQHVHMVERNQIVAALLRDAMRRLQLISELESPSSLLNNSAESSKQQAFATALVEKLSLAIGEGKDALQKQKTNYHECDVIYLDPMFPPRQKQSAVKKGMSILHGLLETHIQSTDVIDEEEKQQEEQELLSSAIDVARLRVVVKRPIKAPPLGDGSKKPSYAITGSTNRWDVYVSPMKT
uniref:SAM-dependent MTase RsmB/NOP-type domain-containing protein n=1 Tax=Pseudo-nitzschia australis TaxID=44445 RepID=A0A7S4EPW4_9STRA|mmetsp:Transcript_20064/g.42417  ORF Transcript_20064/g.42417 Transcript_20064/m.42417 type:complete len:410 (+) Transcript_20064:80-1309(+)